MTATRRKLRCAFLSVAWIVCLPGGYAGRCQAQDAAAPPSVEPKGRRTPRETLRTFVESVHAALKRGEPAAMQDAVDCLDLSLIAESTRKDSGPLLAKTLYDILSRLWRIEWETVPDQPEGPPFRRALARGGEEYAILEMLHQPGHGWRLAPDFVAGLPELRARVQHLPRIGDLGGIHDWTFWLEDHMPNGLKGVAFVLAHWQWLAILALILAGLVLGKLVTYLFQKFLGTCINRARIGTVDEALQAAERPLGFCVASLLWLAGLRFLNLPIPVYAWLAFGTKVLAVAAVSIAAYRAVNVLTAYLAHLASLTASVMDDLLVPLVGKTLKIFIAVFGVVMVAEQLGFDVTKMLVGLGIGGLAVALASKDTVENLFGSFTVILDRPFKIGDWVKIGDVEGSVEEVGFRSTRIRTFADSLVTIPNSKLVSASIENFGLRRRRRLRTTLALTYATPAAKVEGFCEGIRELVRRHPCTWKENYLVYFAAYGPSSLDIMVSCYFDVPDYSSELREKARLYLDILRLARRLDVEFAFPTQTLYVERVQAARALPAAAAPPEADLESELAQARREAAALAAVHVSAPSAAPAEGGAPAAGGAAEA
jgi:MscS family membrane protein